MVMITDQYNLRYYTGFRGGEGVAFVLGNGKKYLIVDSRYTEAAKAESDFEVIEYNNTNPMPGIIRKIIEESGEKEIGFEDKSLIYSEAKKYMQYAGEDITFTPLGDKLLQKRQIKNEYELECLAKAESF